MTAATPTALLLAAARVMSAASPLGNLNSSLRNLMNSVADTDEGRHVDRQTAVTERRGRGAASCLLLTATCNHSSAELDVGESLLNYYRHRAVPGFMLCCFAFFLESYGDHNVSSLSALCRAYCDIFFFLTVSNLNAGGKASARQGNMSLLLFLFSRPE